MPTQLSSCSCPLLLRVVHVLGPAAVLPRSRALPCSPLVAVACLLCLLCPLPACRYTNWIVWVAGLVQTAIYCDFFYHYIVAWINRTKITLPV